MDAPPVLTPERIDAMLSIMAEVCLDSVVEAGQRQKTADDLEAFDRGGRTLQRACRNLRQTIAMKQRHDREQERKAEDVRRVAQDVRKDAERVREEAITLRRAQVRRHFDRVLWGRVRTRRGRGPARRRPTAPARHGPGRRFPRSPDRDPDPAPRRRDRPGRHPGRTAQRALSPLAGRGLGVGVSAPSPKVRTPTPSPSPQGGGEMRIRRLSLRTHLPTRSVQLPRRRRTHRRIPRPSPTSHPGNS